jgi:hypothetical protein
MAAPGGPAAEPHIDPGLESDGGRAAGARRQCRSQSDTESPTLTASAAAALSPRAAVARAAAPLTVSTGTLSALSDRASESEFPGESGLRTVTVTPESFTRGPELEGVHKGRCSDSHYGHHNGTARVAVTGSY